MQMKRAGLTAAALSLTVLAACGGSGANSAASAAAATPTATPQATPKPAAVSVNRPPTANAVEFEHLLTLLPEPAGWTRSTPRGEQISMGLTMSRVQAEYQRGESAIDLQITDSTFNPVFLSPLTTYLAAGYSERTNEGYRKAAPVSGQPAFETWNSDARRAEVIVVVASRYVVQATGHNVDNADAVRSLVQNVDFSRLSTLK